MQSRGAIVVGAGPRIGAALALRLAEEGYDVGLVGLDTGVMDELVARIGEVGRSAFAAVADVADSDALAAAVQDLAASLGSVELLHFNPSWWRSKSPLSLTPQELAADVSFGVGGLLVALQAALPTMRAGSRITATGSVAADAPNVVAASLGVQKAGLRNLVQSIDLCLAGDGIRAASVTVDGVVQDEGVFSPEAIAEAITQVAGRDEDAWTPHVRHP
ncbi:SDR family NAD(P)-dependent oxidoreductase [Nocardioides immobilis]|uniref:SDR family NAD(P)-dependent oxidoreductase n=1 Tax=Nocardioides immobilis TaxID=2049295 RepID=A0A417XTM5_9ACTN|nr:SDR family NAD(P)-dependent oxidoreductase [Nocardioides immobilis]RHW23676.1 SDR family NAD(P)-dependent oxidoreductase [Nocardioides immobilis]